MSDMYHIQISVYIKVDTIYGAKAAAYKTRAAIEALWQHPADCLDEVIIDAVGKESDHTRDCECDMMPESKTTEI